MFTDLKPYPEYAESGVTWLGPTPVHWNVRRAKYLFRDIDVRSKTGHEEQLSVSHLTGVSPRRMKTITMFKAVSYVGHKTCLAGDLVVNTMWAWMGALGIAREAGLVSPAYNVYRPLRTSGVNVEFVALLFRTPTYIAYFRSHSTGLRPSRLRFYPDELLATPALLPPWDEQAAIVKYLGHANAQIDRAIAGQRKLIALLEEQKQAVINQAVTRGLNSNVKARGSGVPWIGDAPAHWEVARLKDLLERNDGGVWGEEFDPAGTVVLRSTEQTVDGSWRIEHPAVILLDESQVRSALLVEGDLVVTKSSGSQDHIGKASVVDERIAALRCCYSNFMQRLRPNEKIRSEYLGVFLNSRAGREHYRVSARSTTGLGNLTRGVIASMPIPLPPSDEQSAVLAHLRVNDSTAAGLIERASREIALLREFRTRLTADVVTGQLDIRDAAARLPELDPADLVSDVGQDEDDLEVDLAASLEEVDG